MFLGSVEGDPIYSKAFKKFNIDINVLGGAIDLFSTMQVGHLMGELIGDMYKQNEAIAWYPSLEEGVDGIYEGI